MQKGANKWEQYHQQGGASYPHNSQWYQGKEDTTSAQQALNQHIDSVINQDKAEDKDWNPNFFRSEIEGNKSQIADLTAAQAHLNKVLDGLKDANLSGAQYKEVASKVQSLLPNNSETMFQEPLSAERINNVAEEIELMTGKSL